MEHSIKGEAVQGLAERAPTAARASKTTRRRVVVESTRVAPEWRRPKNSSRWRHSRLAYSKSGQNSAGSAGGNKNRTIIRMNSRYKVNAYYFPW